MRLLKATSRKICSIVERQRGLALLPILLMFVLLIALAAGGLSRIQPEVKRNKQREASNLLSGNYNGIISWAAANRCIPSGSEFPLALRDSKDPWGKGLVYIYDGAMSTGTCTSLCALNPASPGVIDTIPRVNGRIAFIIISGGAGHRFQSTINGSTVTTQGITAQSPAGIVLSSNDVFKVVTLADIQNGMGCYTGRQQGRLQILNNQLPDACLGAVTYSAIVMLTGGVSPYTWNIGGVPQWLTCNGGACTGTFLGQSLTLGVTGSVITGGTITFSAADSTGNTVTKALSLNVIACN